MARFFRPQLILPPIAIIAVLLSLPRGGGGLGPEAGLPLLEPLSQTGSLWPTAANARYDWAWTAASNGTTYATILADVATGASYPSQEGQIIGRDTTGAQQHTRLTITTGGALIWSIATALTTEATCTTPAATLPLSTRTRIVLVYDGLATGNANRARVFTASVDLGGIVGSETQASCTFAGTIPAAWTTSATAVWSIGQRFGGAATFGLRSVTLYEIAAWFGLSASDTSRLEIERARDLEATSLGVTSFRWSFSSATVTDTRRGAGGLTGTSPASATAQSARNRLAVSASPGCGRLADSATATISQTWALAVGDTARTALVVTPGTYSTSTRYPIVLVYHGCSFSTAAMRADELAAPSSGIEGLGRSRAIYVYLQGAAGPRGGQIECPTTGDTGWTSTQTSTNTDMLFSRRVVSSVSNRLCTDTTRVYGMGRSMGGAFANAFAAYDPTFFRAVGTLVSVYRIGTAVSGSEAVIQTGNDADPVATFAGQSLVVNARDAWLAANSCSSPVSGGGTDCVQYTCASGALTYCLAANSTHTPSTTSRESIRTFFSAQGI
jgi:poly(3-hydroxybutyrate) depolymerase